MLSRLSFRSHTLFLMLLAFIVLTPLAKGSNVLWAQGINLIYVSILSLLTLASLASNKITVSPALRKSSIFQLLFLGLLAWQALQPYLSEGPMGDRQHHQDGILFTFMYFLVFNLTLLLCDRERRVTTLLLTIVASGAFQAVFGSMMVLSGIEWLIYQPKEHNLGVATGSFVNRNHLAGYLEIALACGTGLLLAQMTPKHIDSWKDRLIHWMEVLLSSKVILRIALCVMVIALVMTRSRMGNTAFFASLTICGFAYMVIRQSMNRSLILLFASLFLIDVLIVSQWFGLDKLAERLNVTLDNVAIQEIPTGETPNADTLLNNTSTTASDTPEVSKQSHSQNPPQTQWRFVTGDSRDSAWQEAMPMVNAFWKVGIGYGNFYTRFPQFRQGVVKGYFHHAHNDYLEFIIEFGVVGFALFAALVLVAYWRTIKGLRIARQPADVAGTFAAFMAITAIAIHSWTDFNLYIQANALLIVVMIAVGHLCYCHALKDQTRVRTKHRRRRRTSKASAATP
ncbi:Uncharacterised protein [BD1-7 clade bacterium]|uniref:O-antigen ligase-related domain-containing protein n=1 Tax=BD1-7 clade bacterium TaxID=2029982 RepID=A0A5S9QNN0_9GAMM|nr:Uncharacterised protein [BD1-7 clade bacterium]CAA0121546.1 Uncharacterised protein [BD1-7 clade bacterium]